MSVYDRDPDSFTPPARSTRSSKKGPLYTFSEAERREFLRKKKEKLEKETGEELEQKVAKLRQRLSKARFEERQRRRNSVMDGAAALGPPPGPPQTHPSEMSFVPPPSLAKALKTPNPGGGT